jgi:hypothetical protein
MIEKMKKVVLFAAVIFFGAAVLSSCKTTEHCPAYGSAPTHSVGKSI